MYICDIFDRKDDLKSHAAADEQTRTNYTSKRINDTSNQRDGDDDGYKADG